jgi:hypothetical protein
MHEHVTHLGELAKREAFRVCLFTLSLTGTTFTWYTTMPNNSINSWEDLEQKFHEHCWAKAKTLPFAPAFVYLAAPTEAE